MPATGEGSLAAAAVEWVLEIAIGGVGAVRVVLCAEGRRVAQLHVAQHSGECNGEGYENGLHGCRVASVPDRVF